VTTSFDLFAGGGGWSTGAMRAGLTPVGAIEHDARIAEWYTRNVGPHVTVADVCKCNPADFPRPDVLLASPPCPNFSVAKSGAEETEEDIAMARAVARFISVMRPRFFALENVYYYRKSASWRTIATALREAGYGFRYWHLNAADYGVPQTRQRMFAIARRDGRIPHRPAATHAHRDDITPMFDRRLPWVGWYEAIEDLIPDLPETQFAQWQLERLPEALEKRGIGGSFVAEGTDMRSMPVASADEPCFTIKTSHWKAVTRAFIVDCQYNGSGDERGLTIRTDDEPVFTTRASENQVVQIRAMLAHGRVVKMTPRALARFQSFPDDYELPENNALACRIIGNAVPPLLAQRLCEVMIT
jgi:DNA (cytosine-5)-methyltransferase 1